MLPGQSVDKEQEDEGKLERMCAEQALGKDRFDLSHLCCPTPESSRSAYLDQSWRWSLQVQHSCRIAGNSSSASSDATLFWEKLIRF